MVLHKQTSGGRRRSGCPRNWRRRLARERPRGRSKAGLTRLPGCRGRWDAEDSRLPLKLGCHGCRKWHKGGAHLRCAFVKFTSHQEAQAAITTLHGSQTMPVSSDVVGAELRLRNPWTLNKKETRLRWKVSGAVEFFDIF
ncbi:hypothetical protein CpipJ_CPIJ010769 [Culex quinquefasciatus]|uniref:RRM domain-containing protein n=1 Tax=Culex quinquefasciatus TaxID=7176 RepID=B0WV95_CULQU|nr:hypothetical protein CpipJ_CPIJ010769 [Culex quinquefasciatus]|eukprot:XP_001861317.1 hypothetical protein CpipJ_CPIJ010769 [Culex quinquefasciatus]